MNTQHCEALAVELVRNCKLQQALMDVLRVHRESWGTDATLLRLCPELRLPLLQEVHKDTGMPLSTLLTFRIAVGPVPVLFGHLQDPDAYVEVYGDGASQFRSI